MAISKQAKSRIVNNIGNTRSLMLKRIPDVGSLGDYALIMIGLSLSNIAEVMLEGLDVGVVDELPTGAAKILGREN